MKTERGQKCKQGFTAIMHTFCLYVLKATGPRANLPKLSLVPAELTPALTGFFLPPSTAVRKGARAVVLLLTGGLCCVLLCAAATAADISCCCTVWWLCRSAGLSSGPHSTTTTRYLSLTQKLLARLDSSQYWSLSITLTQ